MLVLKGAVIPVVDPVEQHAERIEVDGGIRSGHNVGKLRRGIGTEILFRNGGVLQILQRGQTEIAELETAGSCQKYVLRLQIGKEITSLTAGGKRFAQIQTEIDRAQTRHSALGEHGAQRDLTGIEYVDVIADAGFLRLDLTAHRSQKVAGGSKLLPDGDLGLGILSYRAIIGLYGSLIRICAGKEQSIGLLFAGRNGNVLDDKTFAGVLVPERIAATAIVSGNLLENRHAVQKGRDQFQLGHRTRLLEINAQILAII